MIKFMELQVCASNHEAVCYYNNCCPVCDARREVEEHEKENDELRERVQELEEQLGLQQPVNGGRHE